MDREGERAQPRIGADVARRLLTPYVLLAGGEGQDPAAPPLGIERFAGQPPRHLADEFLASGKEPDMGPAEIERIAEGLTLGGDDVGAHLAGRNDGSQGQDLGDDDDEERALLVAD